ncbi:hypothetical protein R6U79_09785 [Pseudomonas putida]|uniref:hypothetical protein n=1 Tax=Pseudomonas putida TaxID=303 RepID=UPI0029DE87BE|nr:hypothetical protein [Pseudomonas putida]WPK02515.1 hypothetical protein R6U79_09785 [Pseudomonas putida]
MAFLVTDGFEQIELDILSDKEWLWKFGIFKPTKKNPADFNLRGFRMVEAEVGIEPA